MKDLSSLTDHLGKEEAIAVSRKLSENLTRLDQEFMASVGSMNDPKQIIAFLTRQASISFIKGYELGKKSHETT